MATSKKESKQKQETDLIPPRYQHLAAVLVIFISLIVFFHEVVFDGNVFVSADSNASKSYETLLHEADSAGVFPLWNPYIFCGMPGYASLTFSGERLYDITTVVLGWTAKYFGVLVNSPTLGWELFYYLLLGIGFYFFVHEKTRNKIAALVAALGVMHSTFIVILIMVGHMTKVPVIAFFPFVFLILEKLHAKFSLLLSFLLVIIIHFMILPSHLQMIFYCYAALGVYYLFFLIRAIVRKEPWKELVLSGVILAIATALAVGMTADQYLSTQEYSKYSMRGADPITASPDSPQHGESSGGLDYDYATEWSFSPGETFTFLVPSLYGFGDITYQGILSRNQPQRQNFYFGPQRFTDAPQYMGVVILFLGVIGFWMNRKLPFVQYTGIVIALALLLSYGREFPILYSPMFHYFPMFDKFRIPSMSLILVQMLMPVLAGYGVASVMKAVPSETVVKRWRYLLGAAAGILVISVIARGVVESLYSAFIPESMMTEHFFPNGNANEMVVQEIYSFITNMVVTDVQFGSAVVLIALGSIALFWMKKIRSSTLAVILCVAVIADLWRVNGKPMETHPPRTAQSAFATPGYVSYLKSDTTNYRVLEFENGQPPYNNGLAYWKIQSAYGYHGAKMRQVQDMFDVVGLGNPMLWGLMNVKYVISDRRDSNQVLTPVYADGGKYVLRNNAAMPRAFFVNKLEVAKGIDILRNIKAMSFNPFDVAYVMTDPGIAIDSAAAGATASYVHYGLQDLTIKAHATGTNMLFLSESWYPEGWKASVDGTETPIYRLDYMFRGVVVPPGDHTVTMTFEPRGYYLGKTLVLWINLLMIGGAAIAGFVLWRKKAVPAASL